MPREVYELNPAQLEWLIDNQTLTSGEALDESAKMGWDPLYNHENSNNATATMAYYHQPPPPPPPPPSQQQQQQHLHPAVALDHQYHSHAFTSNGAALSGDDMAPHYPHEGGRNNSESSSSSSSSYTMMKNSNNNNNSAPMETEDHGVANNLFHHHQHHHHAEATGGHTNKPADPYPHRVGKLTWEQSFENLKIYAEKNGHCNVPRYFNDHPQLGSWVHRQRLKRKSPKKYGYLSPEQIQFLTELGFCWQLRGEGKEQYRSQAALQKSNNKSAPATTHTSG